MLGYDKEFWTIKGLVLGSRSSTIQKHIKEGILQGILRPGEQILSQRMLSQELGISVSAIKRAYIKLKAQGWLMSENNVRTFVAHDFPGHETLYSKNRMQSELPNELKFRTRSQGRVCANQDFISIGFNTLSPAYFPVYFFSTSLKEKCSAYEKASQMQQVIDLRGFEYKDCILRYLNTHRSMAINNQHLEVIFGRRESLYAVCKTLLVPGDIVINTEWRDPAVGEILSTLNITGLPMDMAAADFLNQLDSAAVQFGIRAIFIRPQCSVADARTLSPEHCEQLIALAKKRRFYIIEEDDHHEFWYKRPYKPLIRYGHGGHVIYLGALSMLHSYLQNTRTLIALPEIIAAVQQRRYETNIVRDLPAEYAFIQMMETGKLAEVMQKVRIEKKKHLFECHMIMHSYFHHIAKISYPETGLYLMMEFESNTELVACMAQLEQQRGGVPYHPESLSPDSGATKICIGYGTWHIGEAESGAKDFRQIINN